MTMFSWLEVHRARPGNSSREKTGQPGVCDRFAGPTGDRGLGIQKKKR